MIRPPRLGPGAVVSLVAPAGPLADGAVDRAVQRVRDLGWEPRVGPHAHGRRGYLSGSDDERLADLQAAMDSPDNDAIWCLRGGYGTMRILARLDVGPLRRRPRPLIGFSDNTALHLALRKQGIVGFHGPHPATSEFSEFSIRCLRAVVEAEGPAGILPLPETHRGGSTLVAGTAAGRLVGGNLALLAATVGTPYQVDATGAILFMEDVGEPMYRIDRLLSQLLLAGVFDGVAAIAIGAFSECPDQSSPEIPSPPDVVLDRLGNLGVPIGYDLPFGHISESWTLPTGVMARFDAGACTLELLEPAVTA